MKNKRKFYSASEVMCEVYPDKTVRISLFDNKKIYTYIADGKESLVSQRGLQVLPISDPSENWLMEDGSGGKNFGIYFHPDYPFNLYDVKFPYEIGFNAVSVRSGKPENLRVSGAAVAYIYFAMIYAQKGLLPSDCVPGGKGVKAGFSRTRIENTSDYYNVYGRWAEYAVGKEPKAEFEPVVDETGTIESYKVKMGGEKRKTRKQSRKKLLKTEKLVPYKRTVDAALKCSKLTRLCAKNGDSKETLYKMYKEVWRPNQPEEFYTNDAMYKAMLETEK